MFAVSFSRSTSKHWTRHRHQYRPSPARMSYTISCLEFCGMRSSSWVATTPRNATHLLNLDKHHQHAAIRLICAISSPRLIEIKSLANNLV